MRLSHREGSLLQFAKRSCCENAICMGIALEPANVDTHSLRRTKAVLTYRRTGNLRAVQFLLGHSRIECTVRYLRLEVDDAIQRAEKVEI